MTFPQYSNGCQWAKGVLKLSKIGAVRMIQHRPLEGTPKTCTVRRSSTGKWYVSITCEVDAQPMATTGEAVGIDVGLRSFYTLSTSEQTPCPKFLRTDEKDLKRTQRKLSAAEKGTPERWKRRRVVARVHERIANRRSNIAHQEKLSGADVHAIAAALQSAMADGGLAAELPLGRFSRLPEPSIGFLKARAGNACAGTAARRRQGKSWRRSRRRFRPL